MKRSKKRERLRFFLKGGDGTSAALPINELPLKVKNEPQMSDQSTNLDDLDEEDWPSRDSFRVDPDFSDLTKGSSRATESERETIMSTSSSTSSRRSSLHRAQADAKIRELTQQMAEMNKALTQMRAMCATIQLQQQEPVVRKSATIKLPYDSKIEPMTVPTKDLVVDTISWNNTTIGVANTSPVNPIADDGLLERNPCTSDTKSELISPEQLKLTEAISKAMSKELAPLIANRYQTAVRPTAYRGSKDGTIDEWLLVMKRYLERVSVTSSPVDKAWAIIDHLGDEARSYIINKPESERDSHETVSTLLSSRFGTGSSRWPVRKAFRLRSQLEKEDLMHYLDALEGLRSQGFPDEPLTTRRYEILHRFMDGVSDSILQRELTVVYATEAYLTDPPTVESLRFTVQELQRRRHQQQLCDPGCPRSVPYQSLQGEQVPAASVHTTPVCRPAATSSQRARCVESACSKLKLMVHSAEGRHIQDTDRKPQQVAAAAISAPAAPVKLCTTTGFADCPTSSVQSETLSSRAEVEEKADALQTAPTDCDRVLMLRPADQTTVNAPLTVTCGTKQVQTTLESTTFDPSGRTLQSVHLMLASEQQILPDLTLEKVKLEQASNPAVKRISLPLAKEWYTEGEASTVHAQHTPSSCGCQHRWRGHEV